MLWSVCEFRFRKGVCTGVGAECACVISKYICILYHKLTMTKIVAYIILLTISLRYLLVGSRGYTKNINIAKDSPGFL